MSTTGIHDVSLKAETGAAAATVRQRLDRLPALEGLLGSASGVVAGVPSGAVALLAWWLRERSGRRVVLVTAEPEAAWSDATVWTGEQRLGLFPPLDIPAFDRVPPSEEVTRRRLHALQLLLAHDDALVITSPAALLQPTLPQSVVREQTMELQRGQKIPLQQVVEHLVLLGYRRVTAVASAGEFAVRGGIVDVFGLDRNRPWRAEWFGDEVEELRVFEVETQTSVAKLERVSVWPARELDLRPETVAAALSAVDALDLATCRNDVREVWERDRGLLADGVYDEGMDLFVPYLRGERVCTLLDHLDQETLILFAGGADRLWRAAARHAEEIEAVRSQEEERGELPAGARSGLADLDALREQAMRHRHLQMTRESEGAVIVDLGWRNLESWAGRFEQFVESVRAANAQQRAVIAVTRQQHRVEELLAEAGVESHDIPDFDAATTEVSASGVSVVGGELSGGVGLDHLDVFTDHELFGIVKRRGSLLARGARRALSTSSRGARKASSGRLAHEAFVLRFAPGDLVVHRDHGVGRFLEMRTVDDDGGTHEYMVLEYADADRLLVPVAHLDRVDRYIGGSEAHPALSRLGTGEWERTKRRVKERTEEVARELLALYSRRESAPGHAYAIDGNWQQELEASFPYQETPDQEMVLSEIKRDMEQSRPMDRVVCGDVGFGKTELALRAAFKAASEGKQVALLVPTTVLSQQHYLTFSERLRPFPITVGQLSRFVPDDQQARTLAGLRSGAVDIVIGTHRLLQKDVEFSNLGLVIIDEEQRFGVMQKERFKQLRVAVDVLSLSATPIPRTLHMSLAGIRDLSVIQTPPEERQPIKTYVTAREDSLIREVITRELARGGQVFYVHNRVQTIEREAEAIRKLVPEARVAIGHGQMPETLLASVMKLFGDGEIDVLVCTTIIESGLDIPNANTIIVNDSHRFGLAQLYQLRGRVGRAGQRAYAYLLYPPERSLTEKADKRLEVIGDLQDLGAGFTLAMRDLEIRGAGNLLGEEQHGEIAAVGLELYNTLLRQAVGALQGKPEAESPVQVTVSLPLPAYLPTSYVADERLRLRCYQQLAACTNEADLDRAARSLADRFGPMPETVDALIYSLRVRLLAAAAGVQAVETSGEEITMQLPLQHHLDIGSVAAQRRGWLRSTASRLYVSRTGRGGDWRSVLVETLRELGRLKRATAAAAL